MEYTYAWRPGPDGSYLVTWDQGRKTSIIYPEDVRVLRGQYGDDRRSITLSEPIYEFKRYEE